MAERERLTKKERRERDRRQRKEAAAAAARRQRRNRITTILATLAVLAGITALLVVTRDPAVETDIAIDPADAEAAAEAAGCEPVDIPVSDTFAHLTEPAPPAEQLYPVRPTSNGRHLATTAPIGAYRDTVDERQTTHNLEHGAVIAWYDPDQVSGDEAGRIRDWAEARNSAGFRGNAGGGIIAAPYPDGLSTGKAVALRAWVQAVDCDGFDPVAADAFLIRHFGTHGVAPERSLAPYPEDVLVFSEEPAPGPTDETGGASPTGTDPTTEASPEPEEGDPTG